MAESPFEPDEYEVRRYDDERIEVIFRADSGRSQQAIVPRSTIPQLIAKLVSEIGPGQGVPIAGSLRPGQTILVQGFGARRHPDGSADLTILVHLPDQQRDVSIPLQLSSADVAELLRQLGG